MSHLNKKVLGAGALVALSAFVPNPFLIGSDGPLHLGQAMAQATAKDTMNVTAKIVNPLKVVQLTKLNFGSFAVGNTDATIKLTIGGVVAIVGGDPVIIAGDVNGKVSFVAPKSVKFTISVPELKAAPIDVKLAGTGATDNKTMKMPTIYIKPTAKMTIKGTNTENLVVAGATRSAKIIDAGGIGIATLGAVLSDIDDTQVLGTYTGTYTILTTL